jgi:hypothetical protein
MVKVTLTGGILDKKMLHASGILVHVDDNGDNDYSSRIQ